MVPVFCRTQRPSKVRNCTFFMSSCCLLDVALSSRGLSRPAAFAMVRKLKDFSNFYVITIYIGDEKSQWLVYLAAEYCEDLSVYPCDVARQLPS